MTRDAGPGTNEAASNALVDGQSRDRIRSLSCPVVSPAGKKHNVSQTSPTAKDIPETGVPLNTATAEWPCRTRRVLPQPRRHRGRDATPPGQGAASVQAGPFADMPDNVTSAAPLRETLTEVFDGWPGCSPQGGWSERCV